MDDQILMRVLNRGANGAKQFHSLDDRECVCLTIGVDRLAVDVFHHEKGIAFICRSHIQQSRNVVVIKMSQNLSLASKAAQQLSNFQIALD